MPIDPHDKENQVANDEQGPQEPRCSKCNKPIFAVGHLRARGPSPVAGGKWTHDALGPNGYVTLYADGDQADGAFSIMEYTTYPEE